MSRRAACSFFAFLLFAAFLQWRAGAFRAEFSGSDEAAHLVTSLMVHDYFASGMMGSPVAFAENYYIRYPKVAFGIWPPLFHLSQAAWMLAFQPSRTSVLMWMALWAAVLATSCYLAARSRFPAWAALCLGMVLVSLPAIQLAASAVMADLMMSCFLFAAAVFFGRYLDREKWSDALGFGILSAGAMLVKYNGLAMALAPPLALLLTGRFRAMRRGTFWLPALVVVVLCGPWYFYSQRLIRYAMEPVPGITDIPGAMAANLGALISLTGVPLFVMAVAGMFVKLRRLPGGGAEAGIWPAAASLIAALWIFHSILYPITEGRYLLAAAPALLLFAAAGCETAARWLAPRLRLAEAPFLAVLLGAVAVYGGVTFRVQVKKHYGLSEVAADLLQAPGAPNNVVLVSGPAETEGMLISEMALRDRNQSGCVLRASKVLARSTWMGANYEVLYQTPEQIARFLRELPITTVVFDRSVHYNRPHHRLLEQALRAEAALWAPVEPPSSELVRVFRRTVPVAASSGASVSLDLSRTLGRSLRAPMHGRE